MKRLATVFALTALAAGSIALAQQSPPSTSTAPPASSSSSAMSQDPSTSASGSTDKQALMKKCLTQVQAANPTAASKDIQAYCERQVKAYSTESAPKN